MSKSGIPIVSDVAKAVKPIVQPIAKAIRPLAPILPFIPIPGMFGLSSLVTRALLTGALGGLDKQGKFNVGRGVKSGLLAYGIGSLMPSTAAAGTGDASGISGFADAADQVGGALSGAAPITAAPAPGAGIYDFGYGPNVPAVAPAAVPPTGPVPTGPSTSFAPAETIPTVDVTRPGFETIGGAAPSQTATNVLPGVGGGLPPPTTAQSFANLAGSAGETVFNAGADLAGKALNYAIKNPLQAALGATTAYGAISSKQELDRQKEEAERIVRNRENEKAENVARAEGFLRDYPLLYKRFTAEDVQRMGLASGGMTDPDSDDRDKYEMGGLAALAAGGMPPRYLRGGGDGMSDSIPARIGDKQEARLADGEFVVPADVVSHIGNGSSNAGAKKLYAMMDRVRQARTGKTRQAPAVNMRRMMPV